MRRQDQINIKVALLDPTGKRPKERPKKRWLNGLKQNIEKLRTVNTERRIARIGGQKVESVS